MREWSLGVDLKNMDLDAGRRELNLKEELDAERAEIASWPWYKRWWNFWF